MHMILHINNYKKEERRKFKIIMINLVFNQKLMKTVNDQQKIERINTILLIQEKQKQKNILINQKHNLIVNY